MTLLYVSIVNITDISVIGSIIAKYRNILSVIVSKNSISIFMQGLPPVENDHTRQQR